MQDFQKVNNEPNTKKQKSEQIFGQNSAFQQLLSLLNRFLLLVTGLSTSGLFLHLIFSGLDTMYDVKPSLKIRFEIN